MNKISDKIQVKFSSGDLTFINFIKSFGNNVSQESLSKNGKYACKINKVTEEEAKNLDSYLSSQVRYRNFYHELHWDNVKIEEMANYFKNNSYFQYNYYHKRYEDILRQKILENDLPNIYLAQKTYNTKDEYMNSLNVTSLWDKPSGQIVPFNLVDNLKVNNLIEKIPFYANISIDSHDIPETGFHVFLKTNNYLTQFLKNIEDFKDFDTEYVSQINFEENYYHKKYKYNFEDFLINSELKLPFSSFVEQKKIKTEDIIDGKEPINYSEVIAYKVEKYGIPLENLSNTTLPIQTFFIPLTKDTSFYIDSQILFDKDYTYKISNIVFSVEALLNINKVDDDYYIEQELMPTLYEAETSIFSNKLLLEAPIAPQVEIFTYVGDNSLNSKNKIKINFSISSGYFRQFPVDVYQEKTQKDNIIKKQQNSTDGKIAYSSEDIIKNIIILRNNKRVFSYTDFMKNIGPDNTENYKIDLNLLDKSVNQYLSSCSFEDTLLFNNKYYYCFLSQNVHDYISNPSLIYEIELLKDKENIYPNIKIYSFEEFKDNSKKPSASFRQYFSVEPSIPQYIIDQSRTTVNTVRPNASFDGLFLGPSQERSVWDKRIKFRLISKSTGKKIDIISTFKYGTGK